MTKNVLTRAALTLALALSASTAFAKGTTKRARPSAEHTAAVKKCNDDYKAAQTSARSLKGKERSAALSKAKAERKQCLAAAPR